MVVRITAEQVRPMLKRESFPIAKIYVPVKRRATLRPETVRKIAESMLEIGQETPILVRRDGDRFVLVEGLHRLEACKALGEERDSPRPRPSANRRAFLGIDLRTVPNRDAEMGAVAAGTTSN
jgi:ParB-like chromosome segregation protein Spo0J